MGWPSESTTSTCSTSHSRALLFFQSERTAGIWSARSRLRRSSAGLTLKDSARRSISASMSVVCRLEVLGLGDGPQGQVGLDRLGGPLPQTG